MTILMTDLPTGEKYHKGQKYHPGEILIHKLTKEKLIVLSNAGIGHSYSKTVYVRRPNYEKIILEEEEVQPLKNYAYDKPAN